MTKKQIERRLEQLEGSESYGDLPAESLTQFLAGEDYFSDYEVVDEDAGVTRIDGELHHSFASSKTLESWGIE